MYLSGRPLVVANFNPKFTSLVYLCIFLCTCWYRIMIGTTIYHNIMKTIRCNVATLGRLMAKLSRFRNVLVTSAYCFDFPSAENILISPLEADGSTL